MPEINIVAVSQARWSQLCTEEFVDKSQGWDHCELKLGVASSIRTIHIMSENAKF